MADAWIASIFPLEYFSLPKDHGSTRKMSAVLSLPEGVAAWISPRPWLRIARAKEASLAWNQWSAPLRLFRVEGAVNDEQFLEMLSKTDRSGRAIPVVVGSYLRASLREELEGRGIGYLDRQGNLHLPWPSGLIHVETRSATRDRTGALPLLDARSGLGVHGVRAVQTLLAEPSDLQVSHLAGRAELSLSRSHSVLRLLESEGLVRVTGRGPSTRRHVVDRSRLLDWLVTQPAARRRERQMDVALYARTPHELWRLGRARLDRAGIPHGLTGSAAAAVFDVGPTSVMISSIRVSPWFALEDAAKALQAERTDRGANLRLIRDTGMVGSMETVERDGVRVAPLVRVYLDALSERRGEDIAQRFREVALGY